MDIVYVLGKGSLVDNEEIKYSLRSLERHMEDMGNVYIIGEKVGFLKGVNFIDCADVEDESWKNVHKKILLACNTEEISSDFLLMNDDFFAFDSFKGAELPFYAQKNGDGGSSGPISYMVHTPWRVNKEMYKALPLDIGSMRHMSLRTFYCNLYKAPPTYIDDCILRVGDRMPLLDVQIYGKSWGSIDDVTMLHPEFYQWIDQTFSKPSKYEK